MSEKIELTHHQIKALLEMSEASGDPECYDDLVLQMGGENAHSGPGLYAWYSECPEEGAQFIGTDAEDQARGDASDQYRAELYDEVWEEARALGFGNVTEALSALARQQLDEKPDASAQLASIEVMCAMVEAREWADHVGVGEIGKRVESAISTLRNELQEAQRTAMAEHPDAVRVLHELPVDDIERRVASGHLRCTCPSGDGSLRWPCPAHPPSVSRT